jgi:hypothetical protein
MPLILTLLLLGCNSKDENQNPSSKLPDFNDPQIAASEVSKIIGKEVAFAYKGVYDNDTTTEIAAGFEINNSKDWGIKFNLLKYENDSLKTVFQSILLDGSFSESLVKKIELPSSNYDLIYYNSLDYFLGSGGGEVYSYIVDFNKTKIYYAHLIIEQSEAISLFLSENIDNAEVKNYFVKNFTNDYPSLKIISKDIELNL